MAENMNFIPANELPEAVGDEISVLCVENGQMKRKTGSLGGSYVIDLTGSTELDVMATRSVITTVSYDEFADFWYKGGNIVIKAEYGGMPIRIYPVSGMYQPGTGLALNCIGVMGEIVAIIFANGTWTPPTE